MPPPPPPCLLAGSRGHRLPWRAGEKVGGEDVRRAWWAAIFFSSSSTGRECPFPPSFPRISWRTCVAGQPRPPTWSCWPAPIPGGHVTLNVCAPHRERVSDSARPPGAPTLSPCSQPVLSPALSSLYHSLTHLSHSLTLCSLSVCSALCSLSIGSLCHALSTLCSLLSALSHNHTLSHTRSLWSTLTLGGEGRPGRSGSGSGRVGRRRRPPERRLQPT